MRPLNILPFVAFIVIIIALYFSLNSRPSSSNDIIKLNTLKLKLESGETLDLSTLNGKPYIIRLFASWCPSCKRDYPALRALSQHMNAPIIGIALQDKLEKIQRMDKVDLPYDYIAIDVNNEIKSLLKNRAIPETLIVNAEGVIESRHLGSLK